jgi:hypothetical protein
LEGSLSVRNGTTDDGASLSREAALFAEGRLWNAI